MTPLAQQIVREMTLPIRKRSFHDACDLLPRMSDVHCFDCTEIATVASGLATEFMLGLAQGHGKDLSFLPAPRTWIEWLDTNNRTGERSRLGYFLEERKDGAFVCMATASPIFAAYPCMILALRDQITPTGQLAKMMPPFTNDDLGCTAAALLHMLLAFINTPRVIGRRQHMPHRGLERELLKSQSLVGKFPLHAWTEIKLEITPPRDVSGEEPIETHLNGQKALHFCRAHLRVKRGKLEVVRAHWRGDPAIGIKRSRYRLAAPAA